MNDFLAGAPGYRCTLISLRLALGASTAVLLHRGPTERDFSLVAIESAAGHRPLDEVEYRDLSTAGFPHALRKNALEGIPQVLQRKRELRILDAYVQERAGLHSHGWGLALPVAGEPGAGSFLLLAGYSLGEPEPGVIGAAYYSWLRWQKYLPAILAELQKRYREAAAVALAQFEVLQPLHAIGKQV